MENLKKYERHYVTIETTNTYPYYGRKFEKWYASSFTDKEDRIEPYEDSIGIKEEKNSHSRFFLFPLDIKTIEIVD